MVRKLRPVVALPVALARLRACTGVEEAGRGQRPEGSVYRLAARKSEGAAGVGACRRRCSSSPGALRSGRA